MYSSDTPDDELRAPNEEPAPIPDTNEEAALITDTDTNEEATPITDATPVLNENPHSNTPATMDPTPVSVATRQA